SLHDALPISRTLTVLPGLTPQPATPQAFDPASVRPQGGAAMIPASQTSSGANVGWITATALFAAAWLASTALWLRSRRLLALAGGATRLPARPEETPAPNLDAAFRQFERACAGNDLR